MGWVSLALLDVARHLTTIAMQDIVEEALLVERAVFIDAGYFQLAMRLVNHDGAEAERNSLSAGKRWSDVPYPQEPWLKNREWKTHVRSCKDKRLLDMFIHFMLSHLLFHDIDKINYSLKSKKGGISCKQCLPPIYPKTPAHSHMKPGTHTLPTNTKKTPFSSSQIA